MRKKVLGAQDPAPTLGRCRVVGFNGRSTDAPGGIWGSIAEQLGKADQFARYVSPLLSAPGPEAWKQLLAGFVAEITGDGNDFEVRGYKNGANDYPHH